MNFLKKFIILICIILVFLSLYNDFNKEVIWENDRKDNDVIKIDEMKVKQVKVMAGDTVLSISEKLNESKLNNMHIDKIIADFEQVNPTVNAYQLIIGTKYYFPVY